MYQRGHFDFTTAIDYRDLPYRTRVDDTAGKNRELYGKMYNSKMDDGKLDIDFEKLLPWKNIGWNFYKFEPGKWLRPHCDHFKFYKDYNKLESNDNIMRCNIFLEDWQPGHVFGIEDKVIMGWKKNDYFIWDATAEHWAGNFGSNDRYTLQLTGLATK